LTSNLYVSNETSPWNVTIVSPAVAIAIDLSPKLSQMIYWNLTYLPIVNQGAEGNNETNITEYWVNVSVTGGTADLYIKGDADLQTSGGDVLNLANETYSYNSTNSSVPSDVKTALTTNFANHKIGSGLSTGNLIYLKFFLSAPAGQAAGYYNNSFSFKAVPAGESP
jgi:hypothetical protein